MDLRYTKALLLSSGASADFESAASAVGRTVYKTVALPAEIRWRVAFHRWSVRQSPPHLL